jgi:hypothetical protein
VLVVEVTSLAATRACGTWAVDSVQTLTGHRC